MSKISDAAMGHWRSLLPKLGVDSRFLVNRHGPCPICRDGIDRFRWDDPKGGGGYICNQCGAGDGFDLAVKVTGRPFKDLAREVEKILNIDTDYKKPERDDEQYRQKLAMRAVWGESLPVSEDCPVGRYLSKRIGRQWPSEEIRYHKGIWVRGEVFPAMLSKIRDSEGKAVNIHITMLTEAGDKAPLSVAKRFMPGKLPDGSAIHLSPAAAVMGVAEGIETAMSASILSGIPVWSCFAAGSLAKWWPPEAAEKVVIFGDNDGTYTGQAAAYALANRLVVRHKLTVDVQFPDYGKDMNDFHATILGR